MQKTQTELLPFNEFAKQSNEAVKEILLSGLDMYIIEKVWALFDLPTRHADRKLIEKSIEIGKINKLRASKVIIWYKDELLICETQNYFVMKLLRDCIVSVSTMQRNHPLTKSQNKKLFEYIALFDEVRADELYAELDGDFTENITAFLNFYDRKIEAEYQRQRADVISACNFDDITLSKNLKNFKADFNHPAEYTINLIADIEAGICSNDFISEMYFADTLPIVSIDDFILPKDDLLHFLRIELERQKQLSSINTQITKSEPVQATQSPNNGIKKDFIYFAKTENGKYTNNKKIKSRYVDFASAICYLMINVKNYPKKGISAGWFKLVFDDRIFEFDKEFMDKVKNQLKKDFRIETEPHNKEIINEICTIVENYENSNH